jgi:hypothetical protein
LTGVTVRDLQLSADQRVRAHEPGPGVLVVEDTVDALGDRVLVLVSGDDHHLVVRAHQHDGFREKNAEVMVPAPPRTSPERMARALAREFTVAAATYWRTYRHAGCSRGRAGSRPR